ncbi:MAG: septation protein IspZ [Steroidobacteraceae bacterium]
MKLWTYIRRFEFDGMAFRVDIGAGLKTVESILRCGHTELARDFTDVLATDGTRNHYLTHRLSDGRLMEIEAGYINWINTAIRVTVDGVLVHESHPGKDIRMPTAGSKDPEKAARLQAEQAAQWNRNKYSFYVDIGLGAMFFVLAKLTDDLPFAAITTAIAGLAVAVAQRFVKVDLLGGLAMFGVAMLLVSAAFSYAFDDDWAVKMKSTILGALVATLMFGDAALNRGRYFGGRLARYMPMPVVPQRLALGMALLGVIMAGVNWLVATYLSTDLWLYYTSFGDFILTVTLVFGVMRYAQRREDETE